MPPRHRDPAPLSAAPLAARFQRIFAERGMPPAGMPVSDTPEPIPALERAQKQIPRLYRDAVADHPRVAAWVHTIAGTAEAPNVSARRQVTHGPSLLLVGRTGRGKTHAAYGAIRSLLGAGIDVRWHATTAADLYAEMRPRQGADPEWMLRRIIRIPVLLLDDLGAAKSSEWTEELTYRLINQRSIHQLPTLITSNLPTSDLRAQIGDRVASRLTGMCEQVVFTGSDRRRHGNAA
ncbi:ATP-binding protein [Streptomyces sp. NPDC053048]|uniref:ATP-binding protein n=1 Tax=Streptomyces sp. NPDC053048 TaxID=3365694 RepID=UPI0037D168AC